MKTISEIARQLGVSPQAIDKAKAKAEKKYGELTRHKDPTDGRVIRYSSLDVERILEFCGSVKPHTPLVPQLVQQPVVQLDEDFGIQRASVNPIASFDLQAALTKLDGAHGLALEDSKAVVDAAVFLLDAVVGAVEQKIDNQEAKTRQDKTQLYRLEAARDEFDRRTAAAAARSRSLAKEQTDITEQVQERFEEVADLGKSSP